MRKWSARAAVAVLVVSAALAGVVAEAQEKIKVALMDFDNNAERSWWFYDQLGPAARNQIDTAFSENGELAKRFSVIEREKLALVHEGTGARHVGRGGSAIGRKGGPAARRQVHRHRRRRQDRGQQDRRRRLRSSAASAATW